MSPPGSTGFALPPRGPGVRRTVGTLLLACGVCLLVASAASVARAAMARDAARARWADSEAQRAAEGARAAIVGVGWTTLRGTPVARLLIPRLSLDEVVVEGVGDAELRAGPGHMPGSALPGAAGNSVISAHRDRHFRALKALAVGDTLITESGDGTIVWRVDHMRVVAAEAAVLHDSATPKLTLTTCWPIRYFGPAPDRLIVEASMLRGEITAAR